MYCTAMLMIFLDTLMFLGSKSNDGNQDLLVQWQGYFNCIVLNPWYLELGSLHLHGPSGPQASPSPNVGQARF